MNARAFIQAIAGDADLAALRPEYRQAALELIAADENHVEISLLDARFIAMSPASNFDN